MANYNKQIFAKSIIKKIKHYLMVHARGISRPILYEYFPHGTLALVSI